MISITVLAVSKDQKLIIKLNDKETKTIKLEGFEISSTLTKRPFFDKLLSSPLDAYYNKNKKQIRLNNEDILLELIKAEAIITNRKYIEENSKFTTQQKERILEADSNKFQAKEQQIKVHDCVRFSSGDLKHKFKKNQKAYFSIEYLSDHILFRHRGSSEEVTFLEGTLKNYNTYFQLYNEEVFLPQFYSPKQQIEVTIHKCTFNLLLNRYQVEVSLPESMEEKLMKNGWATLKRSVIPCLKSKSIQSLQAVSSKAKQGLMGIYSNPSEILNFIYAKNNFVAIVTEIFEGFVYEVTKLNSSQALKIELPSIVCPIGQEAGASDCKQFARKNLIGQQVNVYLQKDQGLNMNGNIVRESDWKDIECLMLESGMAMVREQVKHSILGAKYNDLEKKAKQKHKGIHKKELGNKRYEDLTFSRSSLASFKEFKNRRYEILGLMKLEEEAVVEEIISVTKYKIRLEGLKCLVNMSLEGVLEPKMNPNLPEYKQIKQKAKNFQKRHFTKRNITVVINEYDEETNHFVGTARLNKNDPNTQFQAMLIDSSLVYADKYNFIARYLTLEESVKKQQKNIWLPQLRCFQPIKELDKEDYLFEGKFSWVINGRLVCIHPKNRISQLEALEDKLRSAQLKPLDKDQLQVGGWCAAEYEGEMYRAQIKEYHKKQKAYTVEFIDWGNCEKIDKKDVGSLKQLPQELLFIEKQCIHANLNITRPTKKGYILDKIREMLLEGSYMFKKVYNDVVDVFDGESSVNTKLVFKGLLKTEPSEIRDYPNCESILQVQENLRKERVEIWEESDKEDEVYIDLNEDAKFGIKDEILNL